jgi:hypothetical protein
MIMQKTSKQRGHIRPPIHGEASAFDRFSHIPKVDDNKKRPFPIQRQKESLGVASYSSYSPKTPDYVLLYPKKID